MYCPNCGKDVENDAMFCGSCGYKLEKGETEAPIIREASGKKVELKDNSYDLWIKRGKCSENVWMWVFFIFLLTPYAYYKVGKTNKGFLILGLTIILLAAYALVAPVGLVAVLVLLYGTWDTYSTAKKYNKIYSEQNLLSKKFNQSKNR